MEAIDGSVVGLPAQESPQTGGDVFFEEVGQVQHMGAVVFKPGPTGLHPGGDEVLGLNPGHQGFEIVHLRFRGCLKTRAMLRGPGQPWFYKVGYGLKPLGLGEDVAKAHPWTLRLANRKIVISRFLHFQRLIAVENGGPSLNRVGCRLWRHPPGGRGIGERRNQWLHFETVKDSRPSQINGLVFRQPLMACSLSLIHI